MLICSTLLQDMISKETKFHYFEGLNALRFLAASLVIIMHIRSNQITQGLAILPEWPIFFKGLTAVSFFFVLSGFLITYLLLQELKHTKSVNIKAFYMKRIFRIWPLYFIIVAIGIAFYWFLAPKLGLGFEVAYSKSLALFLYLFFGANILNSIYHVGGILHVTWSIAVEEQFYLFWAPLMQWGQNHIRKILWAVFILSLSINTLNAYNIFELTEGWQLFIHTLQFHYMAAGGYVALLLFSNPKKVLASPVFSSKIVQSQLYLLLIIYLFGYSKMEQLEPLLVAPSGFLFAWLIVNVSVNPNKLFGLNNRPLNYLGKISYGIYMYHMIVVYAVTYAAGKYLISLDQLPFQLIYFALVFGVTIAISALSYHLLESSILGFGKKKIAGAIPIPKQIEGTLAAG